MRGILTNGAVRKTGAILRHAIVAAAIAAVGACPAMGASAPEGAAAGPAGRGRATILFFNDAHQLSPVRDRFGDRGGVARLATLVAAVRQEQAATLVLFGGDLAGGTLFGGQFRGTPQIAAFNRLGVDLASFGQHDFDFGSAHTRELVAASRFPWITTNLDAAGEATGGPEPAFAGLPRSALRSLGGLRVLVLGLTDDMDTTTFDGGVRQRDLVAAARAEIARALAAGRPDAVIALAQTGDATAEHLLRDIPELDVVLAEEAAEDRTTAVWIGRRPIVRPAGNLGTVARLDLDRTDTGLAIAVRSLPLDASVAEEPGLAALAAEYDARLDQALAAPAGRLAEALPDDGARTARSPLGSLVADAFRAACGAEVALVPGGSLRAGLPAGPLRRKDVAAVLPFANRVLCLERSGGELLAALEHGAAGAAAGRGTLLQVAGLRYEADLGRVASGVARVAVPVTDQGPLLATRRYRVAMSSYLASGGDGFAMLAGPGRDAGLDSDALAQYLLRGGSPAADGGARLRARAER